MPQIFDSSPLVLLCADRVLGPWLNATADRLRAAGCRVVGRPDASAAGVHTLREEDAAFLPSADIIVTTNRHLLRAEDLQAARRLKGVVYPTIGTDTIDLEAAAALGIAVAHGPTPQNFLSMAESTVMLMLVLLYDLHRTEEILRLNQSRPTTFRARMLAGKTIGLIGYGRIAAAVAQRLSGWEARILAYSPRAAARRYPAVNFVELEELLSTSDIVSLHTTLLPETRHLLNAKRLALMRPSSILVNTSRGAIVDEAALCEALKSGRIAGAALDTFEEEPLREDSPLRSLPNVVLTPHMVGHTQEIFDAMPEVTYENVVRLLRGDAPVYFRNPDVFERWQVRLAELADAP